MKSTTLCNWLLEKFVTITSAKASNKQIKDWKNLAFNILSKNTINTGK